MKPDVEVYFTNPLELAKRNFKQLSQVSCVNLIPAWMSNYIHYEVWDEIMYAFPNIKGATIEVWEWINNFILHFTGHLITYPCWD